MTKWLKLLWIKNEWKMKHIAEESGKAEASCASWFKTGQIPHEKHWNGISRYLMSHGYPMHTPEYVGLLFTEQRRSEGWLIKCEGCRKEFLRYAKTKKYCNSYLCKRILRGRTAEERQPAQRKYHKIDFTNRKHCKDHQISREKIDAAVKDYIEAGGEIEKLPTIEQGALTMIQDEMMKAGF